MTLTRVKSNRGGTLTGQRQRAAETRVALLAAARTLFAGQGYHATGTPELVARAAVTRGALHHHFGDKLQLFAVVFSEVLAELNQAARAEAVALPSDAWARVVGGYTSYLRLIAADAGCQRILLIDGPVVLGWPRWRDLQSAYVAAGTVVSLGLLMRQGIMRPRPPEPLAFLIQAALNDAALSIAHAADLQSVSTEATDAFVFLLEGLRIEPAGPAPGRPAPIA